ncbi:hypothetical protein BY996DRAFT_4636893 [Phakopsora pachyrhizi]|nr:hypothetical protein BY996DRAFT_4636893 [Phakopsora pachyrhizi]
MPSAQPKVQSNTIFVGNIPNDLTEEILHNTFSSFGSINQIQIPIDSAKNTNRNFAFISFTSQESAFHAIDNMHLNVIPSDPNQKILKVNLARNQSIKSNNKQNNSNLNNDQAENETRAIWDNETWIKEHALKEKETET